MAHEDVLYSHHHHWLYDDALAFMVATRAEVANGGPMRLATGEHPELVVSLGRHTPDEAVHDVEALDRAGAIVRRVERGGGATIHGPGQLVCYPVVDLRRLKLDVPRLTPVLEQAVIATLAEFHVVGETQPGDPGVYVRGAKIASVGFRVQLHIVTHGVSLNLDNDLAPFAAISTCGRRERAMTSLKRELPNSALPVVSEVAKLLATRVALRGSFPLL
ncbi:MAG: lipoyl(octanoyl) transferase LipB [Myxococcota bacterium]